MATDLYEILQVESSATSSDIKRAYRKLALKFHPDKVSEEDRDHAEIKFKEVSQAYEILIDDDKRAEYDTYGTTDGRGAGMGGFDGHPFGEFYEEQHFGANDFNNFFNNMNGGPPGGARRRAPRTEDAELEVKVLLEDLFNGKTIKITSTRNIICSHCRGTGAKKKAVTRPCGVCEGAGTVRKIRRVGPGLVTQDYVDCETCSATGKVYRSKDKCKHCSGSKVTEETKILEFEIPKGAKSGESIVLAQESDQFPGKETGDVVMTFHADDHAVFSRRADDLYARYKISLVDALCGFSKVLLKHLDGRGLKVAIPKGKVVRPGDYIKIKGEGMPVKEKKSWFGSSTARGDLYIEMDIEFPQDNWYLEKNDLTKLKNLLPNNLQNKSDIQKQSISDESLPEANIEVITDFTFAREQALPTYPEDLPLPEEEEGHYEQYAQPECAQQ